MDKKTVILGTFPKDPEDTRHRTALHVRVDLEISDRLNADGKMRLSICGDTHYPGARDIESGGQIQDEVRSLLDTEGATLNYPREKIARLLEVWERWHLNDMRAECEHQRASWTPSEKIQLVTYKLRTDVLIAQQTLRRLAERKLARGETVTYAPGEFALANLEWKITLGAEMPEPGSRYEVEKRETKTAGWVKPEEHPRGLLCKPCETCGYKYGSAWLYEPLPADVVAFLEDF